MKNIKYYIGLDVHKERTTHVVRDKIGNILLEGEKPQHYTQNSTHSLNHTYLQP